MKQAREGIIVTVILILVGWVLAAFGLGVVVGTFASDRWHPDGGVEVAVEERLKGYTFRADS